MTYKPYVQFHPYGTTSSCIRKIKLITPIEIMQYGKNELRFCKVYTFQEYFENRMPNIERGPERMIAFGDIAQTLQCVDYVNHKVVLTWFTNNKHENIILGFREFNKNITVYETGFMSATIREWHCECENANEKIKPLTKTQYIGHIRTISGINGAHTFGLRSIEDVLEARKNLKPSEFIELAIIKHYGLYKKYAWHHITDHNWYRIE